MSNNPQMVINILSGPDSGRAFTLGETCFIGRQPRCEIQLTDSKVAPIHARIGLRENYYTLVDLTDEPDIRVNNRFIKSRKLAVGDRISVGDTVMEVVEAGGVEEKISTAEPESGIAVTGMEQASRTGAAGDFRAQVEIAGAGKSDKKARKIVAAASSVTSVSPVSSYARKVLESDRKDDKRILRYVAFAVLLVMFGIMAAGLLIHRRSERQRVERSYQKAVEFAEAHPEEVDLIIEGYRKVRNESFGTHSRLERYLGIKISELEKERASRDGKEVVREEEEFDAFLKSLDRKARELVRQRSYDKALEVYHPDDKKLRERVIASRKSVIENIERLAELYAGDFRRQQERKEAKLKVEQEQEATEKLDKILIGVVEAAIAGQYDVAIRLLENVATNTAFAFVKSGADNALATVKTLVSTDRMLQMAEKETSEMPPEMENLSPVIKAVLAIRADDLWGAQAHLKKARGHLLHDALLLRAEMSGEELKIEEEAIQKFGSIWQRIVEKEEVKKIPKPADCVSQLKQAVMDREKDDIVKLREEALRCREDFRDTRFVGRYDELFKAIHELSDALSDFCDGRIIQSDGNTFFVETDKDFSDVKGYKIGFFRKKTVYSAVDTGKPIAARVEIYSILPFRVLGEKQVVFSLPEGAREDVPAVGEYVLVGGDLQLGTRFITGEVQSEQALIFGADFESEIGPTWKSVPGSVKIEGGKLCLDINAADVKPENRKAGEGDLELHLNIGSSPVSVEFDLLRNANYCVSVSLGSLDFLIGGYEGQKEGIYVHGNLVKPAVFTRAASGETQHVVITKDHSVARIAVDKHSVECRIDSRAGEAEVKKILFFSEARIFLDNVGISKPKAKGELKVVGFSFDKREVVVTKWDEIEGQALRRGQLAYFFKKKKSWEVERVAVANVDGPVGDWLICSVAEGRDIGPECVISLSPELSVEEAFSAEPVRPQKQSEPVILYGVPEAGAGDGLTVNLDTMGHVQGKGYIYPVADRVVHPETGEVLAVWAENSVKCEFAQDNEAVMCRPFKSFPPGTSSNGVLISNRLLDGKRRIDIAGVTRLYTPSLLTKKQWEVTNGEWRERNGRFVSSAPLEPGSTPVAVMMETFGGNVQYDLDVCVTRKGKQSSETWVRDIMLELYFPTRRAAVTFGLGTGVDEGISVTGRTISQGKGKAAFMRRGELPSNVQVWIEGNREEKSPVVRFGRNYNLRIRRTSGVLTFYANGKRLAYVRYPGLEEGDLQFRMAAPEGTVSIGRVFVRELPRSCKTPDEEPVLGEFGYVLWSDGSRFLVDSDMNGIALNRKVSIVSVDKVVQGEKSRTVLMKRIALAQVTEIGPRTAKAVCIGTGASVKRGMKVLPGTQPMSFHFTNTRIRDIDQGI